MFFFRRDYLECQSIFSVLKTVWILLEMTCNPSWHVTSVFSDGFCRAVIASLADVVKTRHVNSALGQYNSAINCVPSTLRKEAIWLSVSGSCPHSCCLIPEMRWHLWPVNSWTEPWGGVSLNLLVRAVKRLCTRLGHNSDFSRDYFYISSRILREVVNTSTCKWKIHSRMLSFFFNKANIRKPENSKLVWCYTLDLSQKVGGEKRHLILRLSSLYAGLLPAFTCVSCITRRCLDEGLN